MPTPLMQRDVSFLLTRRLPPCLSLYQPTHRRHPENQQDPIRYRNLVKTLETSLRRRSRKEEVDDLLRPFHDLARDTQFWNHTSDGLAVLGSPGLFRVFTLQRPVEELAVAANSFHIKPLLRILQSAGRYQVLCLNRQDVRLFEGDFASLGEVELDTRVPHNIEEALGEQLTEQHLGTYGGKGMTVPYGHGSKKDEVKTDMERYFRVVDRAILEYHSTPSNLPLILAALGEHQTPFRQISHNPFLMPKGIEINPASLGVEQLRQRAWEIIEPLMQARFRELTTQFEEAKAKKLGSDDLQAIAEAVVHGQASWLLVEAERQIPGQIDHETGRVTFGDLHDPQVDDLLDDLAELSLKKGTEVLVAPPANMPTRSGAAAMFRF